MWTCALEKDAVSRSQASGRSTVDPCRRRVCAALAADPRFPPACVLLRSAVERQLARGRLCAVHWARLLQLMRQSNHLQSHVEGLPRRVPGGRRLPEARRRRRRDRGGRAPESQSHGQRRRRRRRRARTAPCRRGCGLRRRKDPRRELNGSNHVVVFQGEAAEFPLAGFSLPHFGIIDRRIAVSLRTGGTTNFRAPVSECSEWWRYDDNNDDV